jgi:hypothetical protein
MKAFVTGGTGFIGQQVVRKLLARHYAVYALARSAASAQTLAALGCTIVQGDITDVESMREGMAGSDVVFHIAAWYKVGSPDWLQAEAINVGGTRNVLRLAHELGVPRIIYTSTIAVFGDTQGQLVDETFYQGGPFLSEYDRTKWLAHYKVAVPLIEKGAPIIIVMPGMVYGPGDTSSLAEMMRLFYRGLPALPGPGNHVYLCARRGHCRGAFVGNGKGPDWGKLYSGRSCYSFGRNDGFLGPSHGQIGAAAADSGADGTAVCPCHGALRARYCRCPPALAGKQRSYWGRRILPGRIRRGRSWGGRHGRCKSVWWKPSNGSKSKKPSGKMMRPTGKNNWPDWPSWRLWVCSFSGFWAAAAGPETTTGRECEDSLPVVLPIQVKRILAF